jgi:hypothetical protein
VAAVAFLGFELTGIESYKFLTRRENCRQIVRHVCERRSSGPDARNLVRSFWEISLTSSFKQFAAIKTRRAGSPARFFTPAPEAGSLVLDVELLQGVELRINGAGTGGTVEQDQTKLTWC